MRILFQLMVVTLLLSSCGGDDCSASDYAGTWNGTAMCSGEDAESVMITIEEGPDNSINIIDSDGEIINAEINGCNVIIPEETVEIFGFMVTTSGSGDLDGNSLRFVVNSSAFGIPFDCTFELTK